MTMAWGAALVGHAHPKVLEAATRQAAFGANFAAVNPRAVELAERIAAISPCVERIRFVASGTEATLLCLRVAHAATGRAKVLKFEGAYHGQHPVGVASMLNGRPSALPASDPSGAGAAWVERDVLVAPYNDLDATQRILGAHAPELSAVIVEPLHRCIAPRPGFLEGLRALTKRLGVVLVFDEVVTGFRLALGGAQQFYGVSPDLVAYGKALGGGVLPIAACIARADLDVAGDYAFGHYTHEKNPVSAAAALATLQVIEREGLVENARDTGAYLLTCLRETFSDHPFVGDLRGIGMLAAIETTKPDSKEPVGGKPMQFPARVAQAAWERGLILRALWENVALAPPLCATRAEVDEIVAILAASFAEASKHFA